jgi:hypothetical protein
MRVWGYVVLLACVGCHFTLDLGDGVDAGDGLPATPDPDFKWVDAFPSYNATEIIRQMPVEMDNHRFSVYAPAAVAADGSFVTYEFKPANVVLQPVAASLWATDQRTPSDIGLVTSLTWVGGGYVATTDDGNQEQFETSISTTSVATFASDVEFTNDESAPIPTALWCEGGQAHVFKSSRSEENGDTLTSRALTGSVEDIPAMASQLAKAGFVITAFGQLDDAPTYGMVGVNHGASDAVVIESSAPGTVSGKAAALFAQGYVPVGGYVSNGAACFIFEK